MYLANVLQPLIDFNDAILKFWHDQAGLPWGWAIVGLTFCIRLLILPLTFRQVRSMQELQRLQPELKKLQERFKDDKQRLNQEMMRFYQEHKVNPLGSCLPLLFQFPFFISLFYLLRGDQFKADIAGEAGFGFIPNLAEPVKDKPGALAALIVLYVASQLGSTLVSAQTMTDKNQRRLFMALPFFFVVFVINFPAGVIVYWITTNVWTIGQQLLIRRFLPPPEPLTAGASAASGSGRQAHKDGNGRGAAARPRASERRAQPAAADGASGGTRKPPPPSPRKKKKRTGRRR
ncbi:MAG: YidC/Oxa1 family membrane protein insertase [Thermoleophilaceae bacterium]|nr:YidC/Oxa1 family membrane protein insertase [Thermoleophilaceae bacterium]